MTPRYRIDATHYDAGRAWHDTYGHVYVCGCGERYPYHDQLTRHIANAIRDDVARWNKELGEKLKRMDELHGRIRRAK